MIILSLREGMQYSKLFLSLILFLGACTQKSHEMFVPDEFRNHDLDESFAIGKSLSQARADIQNIRLNCSSPKCSQGVALLAAVGQNANVEKEKKYFVKEACTASFVKIKNSSGLEEPFALTAGHCIPKRLKEGSSCSSDIQLVLANGRRVNCDTVAFVSQPQDNQLQEVFYDVALLKIKDSENLFFYDLNQKGLKNPGNLHSVKMIAMDPDVDWEKSLKATYRETDCWYLQNSYVLPNSRSSLSPLFMNQDCRLTEGNSGAPVLDGGTIVGVQSNLIQFQPPIFPDGAISVASNVSCLDATQKKLKCEPKTERFFLDEKNNIHHLKYMEFIKALFKDHHVASFDKKTQKFMQSIWEQEKKYSESEWVFLDIQNDNSAAFRVPFMKCVPSSLAVGSKLKQNFKALLYGIEMPNLNLSLEGKVILLRFERVYMGNGIFRLNTHLSPKGFWEVKRPLCQE